MRGDLIETYKIMSNNVPYGNDLFNVGKAGINLISKPSSNVTTKCSRNFISEGVIGYWNRLPQFCKTSSSINVFKSNLEYYKKCNSHISDVGNFWEISNIVLEKIEGPNYVKNKVAYNEYLLENPFVARRRGINTLVSDH